MMSPMLHSRALQTFFKTSIETFSFLPNLAKAIVLIPAFKRKSVFDISRSIKSFQSFLYDASIFSPLCLSVNTSFACNISAEKQKSNSKSAFLNIYCNKKRQTLPGLSGRSFMRRLICQRVCCGSLRCTSLWRALFITILARVNIPVREDCVVSEPAISFLFPFGKIFQLFQDPRNKTQKKCDSHW